MAKNKHSSGDSQKRVWVLRAGKGGDADDLFLKHYLLVMDDPGMGDLRKLETNRDAFYERYRSGHPDESRTGSAGIAGRFYRFIHDLQVGDVIVYPSLIDKHAHIGHVAGPYRYASTPDKSYPHRRKVKWLGTIPKSSLSVTATREMGAARTLFEITRHAYLFLKLASDLALTAQLQSESNHDE